MDPDPVCPERLDPDLIRSISDRIRKPADTQQNVRLTNSLEEQVSTEGFC